METTPKEIYVLFESLQNSMVQILDLDPASGWHWIVEAQRRVLESQVATEWQPMTIDQSPQ